MTHFAFRPARGHDMKLTMQDPGKETNLSLALVAGRSRINCLVVSKILERCGFKPTSDTPEELARRLHTLRPGLVVLDGGVDNRECDVLIAGLADMRRLSANRTPCIVLLSTAVGGGGTSLSLSTIIDAVVAKPITPEALQPVVERLIAKVRA